jgi:hypothetical protein
VNPHFRTVALAAASLGLLLSLFLALRPGDDEEVAPATTLARTTAPAISEAEPAATGSRGPGTFHIDYMISGGKPVGGIGRDSISRSRIVVIRVTSDVADDVHLHGYDLTADVAPGAPATIRFTATASGRFGIELEERGLQIAELEVRP